MLSSLLPDVNPQRQDNNSMSFQPIRNDTGLSGLKPIPPNNLQQRLEPSGFKDICPIPATRSTSRILSPSPFIDKLNKATKPVSSFICVFLHIFLVLLHIILLALHISGVEHRLTTSESGEWMTVLNASTQAFYALFCTMLTYLMQRLTLSRNLIRQRQKLVILHDNVNAWSGLGSALQCLWQQSNTTGSLWWIMSITAYLGCVFALQVASSSILQLQSFTATSNVSVNILSPWPGTKVDMKKLQWEIISAVVPSLGQFASSSNAGLHGATLYDTVQADSDGATGNATVDATTFRAECGVVRNSELSYTPKLDSNQFGNYTLGPQVSGENRTRTWRARIVPPYQDQLLADRGISSLFPGNTIAFMVSASIDVDDYLKAATVQHMNWEHQQVSLSTDSPKPPILSTVLEAHIVACNIHVERHRATVNVKTNQLLALSPPPAPTPPLDWEAWRSPKGDNHWDIGSPRHNRDQHSKWFVYPFSDGAMHPGKICMIQSRATCYRISLLQLYFMKEIGLDVVLGEQNSRPPPPSGPKKVLCGRRRFESALSKIFASLLWTAAKLGSDGGGYDATMGITSVTRDVTKWHLNINPLPLMVALIASSIMMSLSFCMSGGTRRNTNRTLTPIDSAGVLQIVWLTNRLQVLGNLMGNVDYPGEDALRTAGMFEVDLLQDSDGQE
ncbi:hypothetical protein K503DRAFT_768991 [Rhizopogon vinicolor AM-OR11-026]|uniref:Uncharacterized protein n=1 Tax=Rhizopogon vinicolor AM-OR11-026 TaxID=1314800 RepID=A0A1B7N587_9AGAM|nr:hypothetical protein K503DRAFT_768991 [Rhizopogon vinicolor AM-OR11-026]